jgi:hypothetical protein
MEAVKRIEIIVPEVALRELTDLLARHGVEAFTVARGLGGRGHRGLQAGDGLGGEFSNASVLVAAPAAKAAQLAGDLRALLGRHGGICLISDAMSLLH